jgi:hypothetical protein
VMIRDLFSLNPLVNCFITGTTTIQSSTMININCTTFQPNCGLGYCDLALNLTIIYIMVQQEIKF